MRKVNQPKPKDETFFDRVYDLVRQVPRGRVTTYGRIADALGGSARVVGWAMNGSFDSIDGVPAHRVLNREGRLTGKAHFATPTMMQELLESEGLEIINDKVKNFEKVVWQPNNL